MAQLVVTEPDGHGVRRPVRPHGRELRDAGGRELLVHVVVDTVKTFLG
jgi:phosphotransferase system IIA component